MQTAENSAPSRFSEPGSAKKGLIIRLVALLALAVAVFATNEGGWQPELARELAVSWAVLSICALGVGLSVISGWLDLSFPGILAISGAAGALALHYFPDNPPLAVAAGLLGGLLAGLFNGVLMARLRLHPVVLTLLTGQLFIALWQLAPNYEIAGSAEADGLNFALLPLAGLPLFPAAPILCGVIFVATAFILRRTVFGLRLHATGSNEDIARNCGVNTGAIKIAVCAICGLLYAVCAMFFADLATDSAALSTMTVTQYASIPAVLLAGCVIGGGRGNIWNILLSAGILQLLCALIVKRAGSAGNMEYLVLTAIALLSFLAQRRKAK